MVTKEAVVFVLDGNASMGRPTCTSSRTTRWECAKQIASALIADLMLRSKTHEVSLVVCKTAETRTHYYCDGYDNEDSEEEEEEIPFAHIAELGGTGEAMELGRPTSHLLRKLHQWPLPAAKVENGDLGDALIVAADTLFRGTHRLQKNGTHKALAFDRRIVVVTDAEHAILSDHMQLSKVVEGLWNMNCRLEVIGLDFSAHGEYNKIKQEDIAPTRALSNTNENDTHDEGSKNTKHEDQLDEKEDDPLFIKRQNEQLLLAFTAKTGGFVMAANELQDILRKVLGGRTPKSTLRKFTLQVAPGLDVPVRVSSMITKASTPALSKRVVQVNQQQEVQYNELGEEILDGNITNATSYWDPENEDIEVPMEDTVEAYRYGSDFVPISEADKIGLNNDPSNQQVYIQILGYMDRNKVPLELVMGPPSVISPEPPGKTESFLKQSTAVISALSQGLVRTQSVAIANMVKTKSADPILVGLFPLEENDKMLHQDSYNGNRCDYLVVLQLPHMGDAVRFPPMEGFASSSTAESTSNDQKPRASTCCDDLIDSLMLPDNGEATAGNYTRIPNPYIRSYHQTVLARVLDPKAPVVSVRRQRFTPNGGTAPDEDAPVDPQEDDDPMTTPSSLLKRARPFIEQFYREFPLTKVVATADKKKKRKGAASYRDFVEDGHSDESDETKKTATVLGSVA